MRSVPSALVLLLAAACATSPLGRQQVLMFPDSQMDQMGAAAYQDVKQKTPVTKNDEAAGYVKCVANAITQELGGGTRWEVNVFDDKSVNAFALPGGKIGVNTGLLKVASTQDQLAAVIGHEVAHVIARHSNERLSQGTLAEVGMAGMMAIVGASDTSNEKKQLYAMLGVGAVTYGVLMPFSRAHESEADLLGLDYMAKAGFDPRASVTLWQNMRESGGAKPPELLSTHPSDETRIRQLSERMPSALPLYEQARAAGKRPNCKA